MITYNHDFDYFVLLFLSIADAKFPTITQILSKAVVKINSCGKSPRVASVVAHV